jgi:hypothetical protein
MSAALRSTRAAPWLLASLALLPLARGGFVAGLGTTVALTCGAIAAAHARARASDAGSAAPAAPAATSRSATRLTWIVALAALWTGCALLPLPEAVRAVLAPGATALDRALGRAPGAAPLTQDPAATRVAVLALGVGLALAAAARRVAADGAARRLLMQAIVAGAAGVALLGIVETFLGRPLIHSDLPPHARPFGPFANRNHAASLLVLALPLALGLARAAERTTAPRRATPWIAAAALLVLALLVDGSRGGTLTALALLAFTFALARLRLWVKVAAAAGLALALVLPGSAWTRRADTITVGERVALARDALTMTRDAPLTGIGLCAFGAAYPPYQSVEKDLRFRHVESEPFELLVEGGVPLLGLALAAGVILASLAARMVRATRDPLAKAIAVSALAVPIHACFDFPLRVPGVVVPWLLVVGALLALADAARRTASAPPLREEAAT